MLGDVVILAMFYFALFGIICVEFFKGRFYYRCGDPDFSGAYFAADGSGLQNISYTVNTTAPYQSTQLCRGPMAYQQTWDNSTGTLIPGSFDPVGGIFWGYACPAQPSPNPNDVNYPNGLTCVYYGNPDVGGYRNFDNILIAWIQIFQHMAQQDW